MKDILKQTPEEKEHIANERVEDSRKRIAKALGILEYTTQEMKWACNSMDWNDEVVYLMEEAATKLGYALAALTTWNDAVDEDKNNQ